MLTFSSVAKATGLNPDEIPADAEIDPELLEQLANNQLTPEDIEIYHDEESGRSFIRSRHKIIADAMGGVEKGHIYQSAKSKWTDSDINGLKVLLSIVQKSFYLNSANCVFCIIECLINPLNRIVRQT